MKNILSLLILAFFSVSVFPQTAVNFSCNDCSGNLHDLYSELDQENVIVICWVMPCSGCIDPSYTTYTEVQGFEATYPGRVHMYICDDEGTLSCPILVDWCLNNNMLKTTRFSDSLIRMTDYGPSGMPKIVVLGGGTSHHVYYVANDSVDNVALHDSIVSALTGNQNISENIIHKIRGKLLPNPSSVSSTLLLNIDTPGDYLIDLSDGTGRHISTIFKGYMEAGEQSVEINASRLAETKYFITATGKNGIQGVFELHVSR